MSTESSGESQPSTSSARRLAHRLRVLRIVDETHDTKSIVLDVPGDLRALFRYEAGQFLTLEIPCEGAVLRRCDWLASSPVAEDEHKVTVKRVAGGRVSNWVHESLREGDSLGVLPPEGRFVLRGTDEPIVLFAGGSGITPVISLVKTALLTTRRTMTLLYANRDARSIIFARELEVLAAAHPDRLQIHYRQDDVHGFLQDEDVASLAAPFARAHCYLCGPGPFMDTVERALRGMGVDDERIHVERFVSPSAQPLTPETPDDSSDADIPDVLEIRLKGKRHEVPYAKGNSLLKTALDAGLDAPFSCEEGFCGCCVAQLLEGEVSMTTSEALTDAEKKKGFVLTCQSRPRTKRCVFEFFDY